MTTATFETDTDKWRALAYALLLHVCVVGALFIGLLWQREPSPMSAVEGEIQATLITSPRVAEAASKAVQAAEQAQRAATPPPQPIPEPAPQTARIAPQPKPQQAQDQPDTVDQQRVSALAQLAVEQQKKEQEEKHRQEQILLQQQAQDEAENKQRLAAHELQRQTQLDAIHREQAKIARQIKLVEEKRKQLQDQDAQLSDPAVPAPVGPTRLLAGRKGDDLDALRARYKAAMNQMANANWDHTGVPSGMHCIVIFHQIPGGEVLDDISYQSCPFNAEQRATIDRALHKQPMPYTDYVKVFVPRPSIDFCYPQEACAK